MYISWVTWYKKWLSKQEAKFAIFVETLKCFTALPLIGKWNHIFSTPFPICGRKLVNMTAIFIVEVHLAYDGLFPAIYSNNLKANKINRIRLQTGRKKKQLAMWRPRVKPTTTKTNQASGLGEMVLKQITHAASFWKIFVFANMLHCIFQCDWKE